MKISSNAYVLDLPKNMGISNILNIEDLTLCSNPEDVITNGGPNAPLPLTPRLKEEIKDVIDHQIVSTRGGGYQKYLVKWKKRRLSKTFMRDFMPSTRQGRVFLSRGELMETSGNHL